ncbi:MAG TPA: hypothetical protein VEB21_08515, partial [Terriglobales bacterium]|nr:hypothetical protein [Terriglobales bacterium]
FAIERTFLAAPPARRWYRVTVLPAVLLGLGAWVALQNYQLFFVDYSAKGDGRLFQVPAAWRYVRQHCDGRRFYFLAAPDPTGSEPMVDIFCPEHQAIVIEQVPALIDDRKAATFIVMAWQRTAIERLQLCYPAAELTEHRAQDQRFLFTSVAVSQADVKAGRSRCPLPAIELKLPQPQPGEP